MPESPPLVRTRLFSWPGKLRMAGHVASARADAERARAADVSWDVRVRAAMAFYELYQIDQSLRVSDISWRSWEC